jgi:hypothetical protein
MNVKVILLLLFFVTACSTTKTYHAAKVSQALIKHSKQLQIITFTVENDYANKLAFYEKFREKSHDKESFIMQDLALRLNTLKLKRDSILNKSVVVTQANNGLLYKLSKKQMINEADPIFQKIDSFSNLTNKEAGQLFSEYASYKNASSEFARFALFTGI